MVTCLCACTCIGCVKLCVYMYKARQTGLKVN